MGCSDFTIYSLNFIKRDEIITKTINFISQIKKEIIGKLFIRVRINYSERSSILNTISNIKEGKRSSSAITNENRGESIRFSMTTKNAKTSNKKFTNVSSYLAYLGCFGTNNSIMSSGKSKKNSIEKNKSLKDCNSSSPIKNNFSDLNNENLGNGFSLDLKNEKSKYNNLNIKVIQIIQE